MIKILMALAMGAALVTGANAADLSGKKVSMQDPVPVSEPSASWSGPWVAILGGYGVGTVRDTRYSEEFGNSVEGLLAEAQAGVDIQFGRGLLGVSGCVGYVDVDDADLSYCAGGRVGFLVTKDTLIFVPLGWRWQGIDSGDGTVYASGPYAGLGMESRLDDVMKNLAVKLEYQHTFYDDVDGDKVPDNVDLEDNRFMAGAVLRFGGPLSKLY